MVVRCRMANYLKSTTVVVRDFNDRTSHAAVVSWLYLNEQSTEDYSLRGRCPLMGGATA